MRVFWLAIMPVLCGCSTVTESATRVWLRHLDKIGNWVQADAEALKYKAEEEAARAYLKELREIEDLNKISAKLVADGFHWRREAVDFTNYAWVTIAKRRGDCDDFAILWESVLKYRGKTERVFVSCLNGSAHAMLLFFEGDVYYLLSNLKVFSIGPVGKEEEAIRRFYGDDTGTIVRY